MDVNGLMMMMIMSVGSGIEPTSSTPLNPVFGIYQIILDFFD